VKDEFRISGKTAFKSNVLSGFMKVSSILHDFLSCEPTGGWILPKRGKMVAARSAETRQRRSFDEKMAERLKNGHDFPWFFRASKPGQK
jgi:hypothetical protein